MWLVRLSIDRPIFVTMIVCFFLVMGTLGYQRIGIDQYPKVDPPVVTITTKYPGAGPYEVETLVSKPIEESVNQIGGIERITSTSRESVSQVVIEFRLELNIKDMQTEVRDKVARIRRDLPRDIEEPLIERVNFSDRPILKLAFTKSESAGASNQSTFYKLRDVAENEIKPRLQQVDGVGQVTVFGGLEREIQVELDRQKLLFWKLTPGDIADAVKRSNLTIPGGDLKEEPYRRSIRVVGEYHTMDDVAQSIVRTLPGGRVIKVGDVARVRDFHKDVTSIARLNGKPIVLLEIKKQTEANTVKVADTLKEKIAELNAFLPAGSEVSTVYDGTRKIRNSLHDVVETIVIAAILSILVIYFFLGSLQSTFITGLALPMSVITTFFALYLCDFTLNTMTLLGISLSVGLILDDAIVVRENIWKRIEEGMPPKKAALEGTREVVVAVIATSLTILATFLPVAFLPGVVGKFFVSFALTVCIAVMCSLFDALTMAPMLSAYLITKHASHDKQPSNRALAFCEHWGGKVSELYEKILGRALHHPGRVLAAAALLLVVALVAGKFVGFTFLPNEENGELEVNFEAPPGTTILKLDALSLELEKILAAEPEVEVISPKLGTDFEETNIGKIYVRLVPANRRNKSTAVMRTVLRQRISPLCKQEKLIYGVETAGGGGGGKSISVAVQGSDNEVLTRLSRDILPAAKDGIPEIVNLDSSMRPGRNEMQFQINRPRLMAFGLTTETVGNAIRGLFEGIIAGQYRDLGEEYDIRVRLKPEDRIDANTLLQISVPNANGESIPLTAVTDTKTGSSPTKIMRVNQSRAALLEGDLESGAPLASAVQKLSTMIQARLPEGYRYEFQGQAKSMRDLANGAIVALFLGAVFIYMIMASLYESLVLPFSILLTLPLAIVGAILSLLFVGKLLDLYAVIGIIMLMGLVTKNAILVIDYVEQLRREGKDRFTALLEGGVRRLRPVMMTTIAMVAGMIPVAIGYGEVNQARSAMGVATIGGLLSSTILSLVVVPCAYIYLDRFRMAAGRWRDRLMGSSQPHSTNEVTA